MKNRGLNYLLTEQDIASSSPSIRKPLFGDIFLDQEGTTWQVEKIGPSIRLKAIKGKKAGGSLEFPEKIWQQYMKTFTPVARPSGVRKNLGMAG